MKLTTTPAFHLHFPCCQTSSLEAAGLLICVPGAIAVSYYSGMAGCTYGVVKSIFAGSALEPTKVKIIYNAKVIASRNIEPCVVNVIGTGCRWTVAGLCSGCVTGALYGICTNKSLERSGRRFPDIKMTLSLPPKFQVIERT